MSSWQFVTTTTSGAALAELSQATNRKIAWQLDGPASTSFDLDGRDGQAGTIEELATDLVVWRDGTKQFRGRLGSSGDDLDGTKHGCSFSAVDYRGLLARRIVWSGSTVTFTNIEQAEIAWQLIADTQTVTGGNLGITRGMVTDTYTHRDRTYDLGANVGKLLDDLGRVDGGFEWEINPDLHFNLWTQRGNTVTDPPLEYGRNVTSLRRTVDTAQFANAVRYSGDDTTTAATAVVGGFGAPGRFELQVGEVDLHEQATVNAKAVWQLAESSSIDPTYELALTSGWWTPAVIWLGDTVRLLCRSGRLDIDTSLRVTQVSLGLDENNRETVTLTVGPITKSLPTRLRDYARRLTSLERR